jgi:DNA-directed RNA polymerase subunit RPC12/RpoP
VFTARYVLHTVYLCVLCGSENKQRLFHCTALTDWWFFLTETECVYYAVRSAHTVYLCVLCGPENKQRLFHCTALTDWFL